MKIALIGRYGEGEIVAGPERVARELFEQLKKKNLNVTFIEYFFSGYSDYTFLQKITGKKNDENGIFRLGIIPLILKLLKEQYDIIHFINSQRFSLVIFFIKIFLFRAKFISTLHGFNKIESEGLNIKRKFLDFWVERKTIKKSDLLIFPSSYLYGLFNEIYSIKRKCQVVHNGISSSFSESRIVFVKKDIYNFVYFNSFNRGLKELLKQLERTDLHLRIFVIGEKISCGSSSNIELIFVSPMNHSSLIKFLSDKDFIIKSTETDSFSIFTTECMTMGIIPIISKNIGIMELIKNNLNGFIYDNISDSLSSVLEEIYTEQHNLIEISKNASKIFEELNWENVSDKYLSLYESIL